MQTDVTAEPDFFAAVAFSGARTGFVFRVGDQGIGYYRDNGGGRAMKRSRPERALALPQPARQQKCRHRRSPSSSNGASTGTYFAAEQTMEMQLRLVIKTRLPYPLMC